MSSRSICVAACVRVSSLFKAEQNPVVCLYHVCVFTYDEWALRLPPLLVTVCNAAVNVGA